MRPLQTLSRFRAVFTLGVFLLVVCSASLQAQGWRLSGIGGESLSEAQVGQGTTVVVVWASWSPKSRDIVQRVNQIAERWSAKARVVTVSFQEDRAAVSGFVAGKGLSTPVFLDPDGAFSRKYSIATLPGLLVLKDGQVTYRGKLPEDPDAVIAQGM
ncbi:MAG TPA: TlpA disulfide reductase family protein [Thermoanaerobaculia bacterium]|jgi:thiol-disulfide isomerase/thioredoxin|nr:TlpA disulfide reductase family protein [Thermoanaerobaculia bacterium]